MINDCLRFIVNSILGENSCQISEKSFDNKLIFSIKTNKENIGKIIGKKGKIINNIRKLVKIPAIKEGKEIQITVEEDYSANGSVLSPPADGVATTDSVGKDISA